MWSCRKCTGYLGGWWTRNATFLHRRAADTACHVEIRDVRWRPGKKLQKQELSMHSTLSPSQWQRHDALSGVQARNATKKGWL